jgi:hypothetical protein
MLTAYTLFVNISESCFLKCTFSDKIQLILLEGRQGPSGPRQPISGTLSI